MKKLIIYLCIGLVGCSSKPEDSSATIKLKGDARQVFFKECMELAAKMPRQSDDDVSDVVSECGLQSHYLTNYLVAEGK